MTTVEFKQYIRSQVEIVSSLNGLSDLTSTISLAPTWCRTYCAMFSSVTSSAFATNSTAWGLSDVSAIFNAVWLFSWMAARLRCVWFFGPAPSKVPWRKNETVQPQSCSWKGRIWEKTTGTVKVRRFPAMQTATPRGAFVNAVGGRMVLDVLTVVDVVDVLSTSSRGSVALCRWNFISVDSRSTTVQDVISKPHRAKLPLHGIGTVGHFLPTRAGAKHVLLCFCHFFVAQFCCFFHHMEPSILVITSIRICIPKRTENISYNWTSDPICTPFASPWCPHFAILTAATPTYSKPMSSLPRRFHRNREVADRKTYNIPIGETLAGLSWFL